MFFVRSALAFIILLINSSLTYGAPTPIAATADNTPSLEKPSVTAAPLAVFEKSRPWHIGGAMIVPFRGFQVQTSPGKNESDPVSTVAYDTSPSLEGAVTVSYQNIGFTYQGTLVSASLDDDRDAPSSRNHEYNLGFLLKNNLFEISFQNLKGMQTSLDVDAQGKKDTIARYDIGYRDTRLRWVWGHAIYGASEPNSLANFYTQAVPTTQPRGLSVDLLLSAEMIRQEISGDDPFVPAERQATFGSSSTLSRVESTGLGLGAGAGLTVNMSGRSYFLMAALLGGNYNFSEASYANKTEDISGFGGFATIRMAVRMFLGEHETHEVGVRLWLNDWMIPAKENKVSGLDSALSLNYSRSF